MPELISNAATDSGRVSFFKKANGLFSSAWFAYLTLVLFQLKVVWGMWQYRDLTGDDTAGYFSRGYLWFDHFRADIIHSPLYTLFYGSLLHFSSDAYVVTILHRLIIVFTLSVLMLALMRKLLPASLAWLVAAWWCVLPMDFNSLYEVHIFAVIPILGSCLVMVSMPSSKGRGWAVAILCTAALTIRNEFSVPTLVLSTICTGLEIHEWRTRKKENAPGNDPRRLGMAYGVPLLLVALLCVFFYWRATGTLASLRAGGKARHAENMGQVYAFGYSQRHPEWTNSPWREWEGLMQRDFGNPTPTLSEMISANPKAVWENMWWNIKLTPNGIQLMLFNSISGSITPDYIPVIFHSKLAFWLGIVACAVWTIGFVLLCMEWRHWWETWLRARAPGWLAMLSIVAVAPLIILTQRPRPSYLFGTSIFLMAFTGMCIFVIFYRWKALRRLSSTMPLMMLLGPVFIPSYYLSYDRDEARGLRDFYYKLAPYRDTIKEPGTKLIVRGYDLDVHGFIIHEYGAPHPPVIVDYSLFQKLPHGAPVGKFLDENGINLFFLDENLRNDFEADPVWNQFLSNPGSAGWERVGPDPMGKARWILLKRNQTPPAGKNAGE